MYNLKIITLNCQKGYQSTFKSFIQKILHGENYDFILLQEANIAVLSIIKEIQSSYMILNPFDIDLKENTHECILYKKHFILEESFLISFAKFNSKIPLKGWGFLYGIFQIEDKIFIIGSVHLHPGIKLSIRLKEIEIIKNDLKKYVNKNNLIIFGGDLNTGFAKEISIFDEIFFPDFIRITKKIGSTLDSRYTENAPFLLNKIAVFFAYFGLGMRLKTDHIYTDTISAKKVVSSIVLNERISDHSAVEIVFNGI
ncbi:MAG: endonuclease/exonuclease/phosphatase family protein [Minisyncoccia bacterium]